MGTTDRPPYLTVAQIHVCNDAVPSRETVNAIAAKLRKKAKANITLVVRPCPAGAAEYELVTGRGEYAACQQFGWIRFPYKIEHLTDEEAATLRQVDVLMGPHAANNLLRGWSLHGAAVRHDWTDKDLAAFLPTARSTVSEAWSAGKALPQDRVVESCRTHAVDLEMVGALTRKHIRTLTDLPEEGRLEALLAHLTADSGGSILDRDEPPPLEPLLEKFRGRLETEPWWKRLGYVLRAGRVLFPRRS